MHVKRLNNEQPITEQIAALPLTFMAMFLFLGIVLWWGEVKPCFVQHSV